MRRFAALFLVGLMALMPMSVLAGHATSSPDAQEMPCHSQDGNQPDQQPANPCGDMKGCCGGFLLPAIAEIPALTAAGDSVRADEARHTGFVPDQLDPPPVVL